MKKFRKHFRIYFKSNHPAFIIDEEGNHYYYHRVTSSPKSGHHSNWKIDPNPNPRKKTPMYIVKRKEKDNKARFGKILKYRVDFIFLDEKKK